ncbi:MAG: lysophospholipid acyltransferase family protein [Burkholderiaceae bacterium]
MRRLWRIPGAIVLLLGGLATVLCVFPWIGVPRRESLIALWSRALLASCGVRVREIVATGAQALSATRGRQGEGQGRLLLPNHISWLDIFVIDSIAPASFVAKAEIARWPLVGTLVARAGTVFVERGRRHAVHAVIRALAERLSQGYRAAVFPEGTTSEGDRLLVFHGNLIQSALNAGVPVVPIGLRYVDPDGERSHAVLYVGDTTFLASFWRITGHPRLECEVHVLASIESQDMTRQAAAMTVRERLGSHLGLPFDDTARRWSPQDPQTPEVPERSL